MIKEIADVIGGGTPKTEKDEYWNGNIQWFTPTEVGQNKYVSKSIRNISNLGLEKSSAKLLPKGTILLSTRATVGECSIASNECCTNQGFQSLVVNEKADNEYIYYLIQKLKNHFIKYACGSTFLEISNKEIGNTIIRVPILSEQKQISTFLSKIDDRIETQIKIIEDLKALKESISYHYFGDNEILSKICNKVKLSKILYEKKSI